MLWGQPYTFISREPEDNIQSTTEVCRARRSFLGHAIRMYSNVNAIKRVVDIGIDVIDGERWRFDYKEYCVVVTNDVRNAFNSANLGRI